MKNFNPKALEISTYLESTRKPDFNNLLKILERGKPDRPTLFEFFLNDGLYRRLAGIEPDRAYKGLEKWITFIKAYTNAGYDYTTVRGSDFTFPSARQQDKKTISLNEGAVIHDRKSFKQYPWPDPDSFDTSRLDTLASEMPEGMKLIVWGPGGVLENVTELTGYDTLCYLTADDPALVQDIFDEVGSRLVRYYELCAPYKSVGALISNDDWGFNTQTLLSAPDLRKYVFPWHKKIVSVIHSAGKPAILHSCGQLENVMDDIIDDMKYDAKHSYEDSILPVEQAYERWGGRIAIFGGIGIDFLCRSTPEEIYKRSCRMLEKASEKGRYALGSGNSIPYYVPDENYLAMISAVR
jgi:uroporphyrinogen decarboxylase